MRDYADEAYLHARIYALRSRLLSLKDYSSLAKSPDNTSYSVAAEIPDTVSEEDAVFKEQIAGIVPLAEATGIYKPLFLAFFRQFEVLNAKLILAKSFGMQPLEQWYDIGHHAILDRSLIKDQKTLKDLQTILKGTYLEDALEDTSSYEKTDMLVDLCAMRNMYKASAFFKSQAKFDFQEFMGRRIAVISAILSMRLKKTYQWDEERIRPYLKRFHNIFEGNIRPQEKVVEKMLSGHLERQQAIGVQKPDVVYMEHYLEQNFYNWISSMFHRDFHSVYCVVAYLWLLYYQIRNLFRIIEGRRFGFPSERILTRIVCN